MNFNYFNENVTNMENQIHFIIIRDHYIHVQTQKYYDCLPKDHEFLCIGLENEKNKGVHIPIHSDALNKSNIHIIYMNEEDIEIITNKIYNHFCSSYSLNFVGK